MASSRWYQGPASVTLGGTDLGEIKGGVTVEVSQAKDILTADKYGDTPVRILKKGDRVDVTLRLAEWDLATLQAAFPSGSTDTANADIVLKGDFKDETSSAQSMVITPTDTAHAAREITIPLAIPTGDAISVGYGADDQQVYEVKFTALYDETNSLLAKLGYGVS